MDLWIALSIAAALFQTLRFALQKVLVTATLSAVGTTFARFAYSAPVALAGLALWSVITGATLPGFGAAFPAYVVAGGLAQILATLCVVALFRHRNFAVGLTFAKTEVIMTALIGLVLLGDRISLTGLAAILVGVAGVVILSRPPGSTVHWTRDLASRATALGVGSGVLFAVSAVSYRGAALDVATDSAALRAAVTLACVTGFQTGIMALWLALRDPAQITAVWQARKTAAIMGLASLGGSFCWFWAFALQNAAYVKAVGQIELIAGLLVTTLWFRERVTRQELTGMALLATSIVAVILRA